MKRYFLISLFGSLCLLHTGCLKFKTEPTKPRELPPLTHDGLNTFGCYVDGELMTRSGRFQISFNHIWPDINDSLAISFEIEDKQAKFHLRIDMFNKIKGPGKYSLAQMYSSGTQPGNYKSVTTVLQNRNKPIVSFICAPDLFGELNIMSYDESTQKMSGTFEFDAVFFESWGDPMNPEDFDTVRVRQGRFDYKR